mmetsp:Transcript_39945/g.106013  ORF Transcript_39945/g.106013 Transcript_39945/m.106013 type:complete len:80 (+) Transcript_39945:710-949(+)
MVSTTCPAFLLESYAFWAKVSASVHPPPTVRASACPQPPSPPNSGENSSSEALPEPHLGQKAVSPNGKTSTTTFAQNVC